MKAWKHHELESSTWGKLAGGTQRNQGHSALLGRSFSGRERGGTLACSHRHHVEHALCLRSHAVQCRNVMGPRLGATSESA